MKDSRVENVFLNKCFLFHAFGSFPIQEAPNSSLTNCYLSPISGKAGSLSDASPPGLDDDGRFLFQQEPVAGLLASLHRSQPGLDDGAGSL